MAAKDDLGRAGEEAAVAFLTQMHHRVLDRNWRCAEGEVDAVTLSGDAIVIVEVKTRTTEAFGHPFEAVDDRKLARLWRLSRAWARHHPDIARGRQFRVDIVGVVGTAATGFRISHLEDVR